MLFGQKSGIASPYLTTAGAAPRRTKPTLTAVGDTVRGAQTLGPGDAHASTTRELLAGLPVVMVALRRETRTEPAAEPAYMNPFGPAWPFLVAGFGMFTALGLIQVVTGFLVQDRLALDADTTGLVTGGALLAAGIGLVLAQSVIVPRSRWAPPHPAARRHLPGGHGLRPARG